MIEKINLSELAEESLQSPSGKYGASVKDVSSALETEGQPFEVEWVQLPPGRINFPCHAHQVQWEFYLVVGGRGIVRRNDRHLRGGRRGRLRAAAGNRAPDPQPQRDRGPGLLRDRRQSGERPGLLSRFGQVADTAPRENWGA